MTSNDPKLALQAAKIWSGWEGTASKLFSDPQLIAHYREDQFALAFGRIESHYFHHKAFFREDGQLLKDVEKIRHIPAVIVQGRYDIVCPMDSAWQLHKAWPEAEFTIVQDAGHSAFEPGITRTLVAATDKFASY